MLIRDGSDGKQGGLALLRTGSPADQTSLVLKYASQGMGHGHFDRLSFTLYDSGNEIISDYGSVRFLNVEAKDGGRYLNENSTWAKQTIAHNTLVVDGKSNFNGKLIEASKFHPDLLFADLKDESFQIVSAVDSNCYKGAILRRTMALVNNPHGRFIIDLFRIENNDCEVVCDMPLYYQGQIMSTNFQYEKAIDDMKVLGNEDGYQHLWIEASANKINGLVSTTWMNDKRFYTCSFLANQNTELFFTRLGANDPKFNLRAEAGLMIRQKAVRNYTFFSVFERHGNYNPGSEVVTNSGSSLESMEMVFQDEEVTGIQLLLKNGASMILLVVNHPGEKLDHQVKIKDTDYKWEGNYILLK
jgi:hypothetical protein